MKNYSFTRTLIFFAMAVFMAGTGCVLQAQSSMKQSSDKDAKGHALVQLWQSYETARAKDRPVLQTEILQQILSESKDRRLDWDFWEAVQLYVDVSVSRNWKLRDSLLIWQSEEVRKYDSPIVTFAYEKTRLGNAALRDLVSGSLKEGLKGGLHPEFHVGDSQFNSLLGGVIAENVKNDYEFALWSIWNSSQRIGEPQLSEEVAGRYPEEAFIEFTHYYDISTYGNDYTRRKSFLDNFIAKYPDKAISLLARKEHLNIRKRLLDIQDGKHSDEYKALYEDVLSHNKKVSSYKKGTLEGNVARQADAQGLAEALTGKDVSVRFEREQAIVTMRNLSSSSLKLFDNEGKKVLWKTKVPNPVKSFYSMDTVKVDLPLLDDGEYRLQVEAKKLDAAVAISRRTLSMDLRYASDGYGAFVTDYMSGEPIKEADFVLRRSGSVLCRVQGVVLEDGYTTLPSLLQEEIASADAYVTLEAITLGSNGKKRLSPRLSFYTRNDPVPPYNKIHPSKNVRIYTDRAAYNPGETVFFNLLAYTVEPSSDGKEVESSPLAGKDFGVTLYDSEGNSVGETTVKTGEWGTADGKFTIPTGLRNGEFRLSASMKGGGCYASSYLTVDEFVLPNFEISFDPVKDIYTPGEVVPITGKVVSYSGHPLTGVEAFYSASTYNMDYPGEKIEIGPDGSFAFKVKTVDSGSQWQFLRISAKVVDNTGETQEGSTYVILVPDISVRVELTNEADATTSNLRPDDPALPQNVRKLGSRHLGVLYGNEAKFKLSVNTPNGESVPLDIRYVIEDSKGKTVFEGTASSGKAFTVDMKALPSDVYIIHAYAILEKNGKKMADNSDLAFLLLREGADTMPVSMKYMLRSGKTSLNEGEDIVVAVGSSTAPIWAVLEIYGEGAKVLEKRLIKVDGKVGEAGSIKEVHIPYRDSYPQSVRMRVLFFRDCEVTSMSREFSRIKEVDRLPLSFESFQDQTKPGQEYSFTIKSRPGVEILAAVFDKSVERIRPNYWTKVDLPTPGIPSIWSSSVSGEISSHEYYIEEYAAGGALPLQAELRKSLGAPVAMKAAVVNEDRMDASADMEEAGEVPQANVEGTRENFAKTLAFEPHILTSSDGSATLTFSTADKLSTYVVALLAHDKKLLSSTLRQETVVSIPVKVSVVEPGVLYCGDSYNVSISLSSKEDRPISGTLTLQQFDGLDYKNLKPVKTTSKRVTVDALRNLAESIPVQVPASLREGEESSVIGMRIAFSSDDGSFTDAVFVSVPLYPAEQTLVEAHSGVLLAGMDKQALMNRIRSSFVNVSGYGAEVKEITIIDMIREAIPGSVEPKSSDVLSLSEAYYMRLVAESLLSGEDLQKLRSSYKDPTDLLLAKINKCRNSDGGFAWFEGMNSSAVITAVILERFWKLHRAGLIDDKALGKYSSSVKFMDKDRFDNVRPYWCGGASDEQYLYIRSMFPEVEFNVSGSKMDIFNKRMKDFKKFVSEYLVPEEDRGLQGQILRKARRLSTLMNLSSSKEGLALAKAWGINMADKKITGSLEDDVLSLLEYAVDHKNGGMYYPNAVMPYRGLLESEAYAHSLLCDILTSYSASHPATAQRPTEIADGLRVWLMIQKETQQWDDEPAFIDAVASVMQGSEDVKKTSVIIMTKKYRKPFTQIKAAGNGMKIERTFQWEHSVPDKEAEAEGYPGRVVWVRENIKPGTVLQKGDRIIATYRVWSEENRSFVRLRAPMEGALRPLDQLSGYAGWSMRSLSVGGYFNISPRAYREVKKDRIDYYMDTCPEETTTMSETFYVTQSGVFHAPVVEIECLYSPHYRANAGYGTPMKVK